MLAVLYHSELGALQTELGKAPYLFLIEHGADVNESNRFLMTPLMMTAFTGDAVVAKILLQNGAQIDMLNYHGETAAHLAFQENKADVLQTLINSGTDTCLRSYTGLCLQDKEMQPILSERGVFIKKHHFSTSYRSIGDAR